MSARMSDEEFSELAPRAVWTLTDSEFRALVAEARRARESEAALVEAIEAALRVFEIDCNEGRARIILHAALAQATGESR